MCRRCVQQPGSSQTLTLIFQVPFFYSRVSSILSQQVSARTLLACCSQVSAVERLCMRKLFNGKPASIDCDKPNNIIVRTIRRWLPQQRTDDNPYTTRSRPEATVVVTIGRWGTRNKGTAHTAVVAAAAMVIHTVTTTLHGAVALV
jgi:hypothetical protein